MPTAKKISGRRRTCSTSDIFWYESSRELPFCDMVGALLRNAIESLGKCRHTPRRSRLVIAHLCDSRYNPCSALDTHKLLSCLYGRQSAIYSRSSRNSTMFLPKPPRLALLSFVCNQSAALAFSADRRLLRISVLVVVVKDSSLQNQLQLIMTTTLPFNHQLHRPTDRPGGHDRVNPVTRKPACVTVDERVCPGNVLCQSLVEFLNGDMQRPVTERHSAGEGIVGQERDDSVDDTRGHDEGDWVISLKRQWKRMSPRR